MSLPFAFSLKQWISQSFRMWNIHGCRLVKPQRIEFIPFSFPFNAHSIKLSVTVQWRLKQSSSFIFHPAFLQSLNSILFQCAVIVSCYVCHFVPSASILTWHWFTNTVKIDWCWIPPVLIRPVACHLHDLWSFSSTSMHTYQQLSHTSLVRVSW